MPDGRKLADVKVGAFVLAALGILIAGSLWIAGSSLLAPPRSSYRVLMKDAGGLQTGDRVRVTGVSVGRIRQVDLHPGEEWPVIFSVDVKRDVPIRTDGSATVGTSGLLGASYLEIVPGSPDAERLAEGGEIRGTSPMGLEDALARVDEISARAVDVLERLSGLVDSVSAEIGPLTGNLERLLSEDNAENVQEILASLRDATENVGPRLSSLLERLDRLSGQLEDGIDGLPALTDDLDALVADLHEAMGPGGERLTHLLEAAKSSLASADATLGLIGDNRGEFETALRDLRDTLANLKSFSQAVKERPHSLVRVTKEPDRRPGDGVSGDSR